MGTHVFPNDELLFPSNSETAMGRSQVLWNRLVSLLYRVLRHAIEIGVAGYCGHAGLLAFIRANDATNFTTGPLQYLPTPLTYIITLCIGVGGVLAMIGIFLRIQNEKLELLIETMGWFLITAGWSAYIVGAFGYDATTGTTLILVWVASAAALRVVALLVHQHLLIRQQRERELVKDLTERITNHGTA